MRALILLYSCLFPMTLTAQTLGLPIIYRGVMKGFGGAVDGGLDSHGFRTLAGTGTVALGHLSIEKERLPLFDVSGTVATVAPDAKTSSGWSVNGSVAFLNSLAIGAGYAKTGTATRLHIPLSALVPFAVCVSSRGAFIFYVAPIWNFEKVSDPLKDQWERSWTSFSAGVLLERPDGIGIQAAGGGPFRHAPDDMYNRALFSIGIHISMHSIMRSYPPQNFGCNVGL